MELALGDLYSESAVPRGMTTEKADLTFASMPYRIMPEFQMPVYDEIQEARRRLLRAAGATPASSSTSATTSPACS